MEYRVVCWWRNCDVRWRCYTSTFCRLRTFRMRKRLVKAIHTFDWSSEVSCTSALLAVTPRVVIVWRHTNCVCTGQEKRTEVKKSELSPTFNEVWMFSMFMSTLGHNIHYMRYLNRSEIRIWGSRTWFKRKRQCFGSHQGLGARRSQQVGVWSHK